MTGRGGYSLAKAVAWKQAVAFRAAIIGKCKAVDTIDVKGKSVRIVCHTEQKK